MFISNFDSSFWLGLPIQVLNGIKNVLDFLYMYMQSFARIISDANVLTQVSIFIVVVSISGVFLNYIFK